MKSPFYFIAKPVNGSRYNNTKEVAGIELIINTSEEEHKFSNRYAEVVELPLDYKGPITVGDILLVHHNVFKFYNDMKGRRKSGKSFFKEDLFFIENDQFYMYKHDGNWYSHDRYCFIKPIVNKSSSSLKKLKQCVGIVKYGNSTLEALKIHKEDLVVFKKNREFEFLINNEVVYCMESNDILLKDERKGNETEYNPSWAKSS